MTIWKYVRQCSHIMSKYTQRYKRHDHSTYSRFFSKTGFVSSIFIALSFTTISLAHFPQEEGKKCRICRDIGGDTPLSAMTMHDFLKMKPMVVAKAAAAAATSQEIMDMTPEEYAKEFKDYLPPIECPPDYYELGQSTWNYIHTMAAYYPEEPDPSLVSSMPQFVETFAKVYPCESCSVHMIDYLKKHPVKANNNVELSIWFCQLHNDVNRKLGKPPIPCTEKYLFERWRDGPPDGQCD